MTESLGPRYAELVTIAVFLSDLAIRVGLSVRVINRRRPVGVSLAWLTLVLLVPFAGAALYLLVGENRLGRGRAQRAARVHGPYLDWLKDLDTRAVQQWSAMGPECEQHSRLCTAVAGIPALPGNRLELLDDAQTTFRRLIADIDSAQRSCHLEFYIWSVGGTADEVAAALVRAAGRGVRCRVLVDAVGSHEFVGSPLAQRMLAAGIQVQSALPVSLLRMLFVRIDLRLHRKIVVIDGEIAYTGSQNLVDPRFFKVHAGVGQWVDAMVRFEGPAVEPLAITFLEDWELETGEGIEKLSQTGDVHTVPERGPAVVQVVPSGPAQRVDAIYTILLTTIYAARHELVLTTPYFVPDEPLLTALVAAAARGVQVTIVLPERVDSKLVRLASQAFKGDLLAAGVRIVMFRHGLLHTKSITVDGQFSLFGSLNLDPRSLWLNFEITLAVYDAEFTARLRELQQTYIEQADELTPKAWANRTIGQRFADNVARLLSPLL
ncbi:MAG: cardiolipin synthase [Pirellulales bacterium]